RPATVAVIIPVHNGASMLAETVESAFAQSFGDIEVLVVDDASTDQTPELLKSLEERYAPRLRWWRCPQNVGPSAARNVAFEKTRAPLVAPLDGDDLWHVDKLRLQVEALERRPGAAVAYSSVAHVDGEGRHLYDTSRADHDGDVFLRLLLGNFLECGSNPLVRADAWRAVGGYDDTLRTAEDWDFYLKLANHGPFVAVPETLTYYRKHPGSATTRSLVAIEQGAQRVARRHGALLRGPAVAVRRPMMANLYRYFLQQVYEGPPAAWRGPAGLRFTLRLLRFDPALRRRPGTAVQLLLKAMIGLLPGRWAGRVEAAAGRLPGLDQLPGIHWRPTGDMTTELPEEVANANLARF
ncbi:MAG: glycosyltransferase family A protein, partial [Acidobacteriota bacterium]